MFGGSASKAFLVNISKSDCALNMSVNLCDCVLIGISSMSLHKNVMWAMLGLCVFVSWNKRSQCTAGVAIFGILSTHSTELWAMFKFDTNFVPPLPQGFCQYQKNYSSGPLQVLSINIKKNTQIPQVIQQMVWFRSDRNQKLIQSFFKLISSHLTLWQFED